MEMSTDMSFSKAFDYASGVTADRFTNPLWPVLELFIGPKFQSSLKEVKAIGRSIVDSAQKRRSTGKRQESDEDTPTHLVDSLLDHIDDPQIVAEAATNFLSAGRDTTAQVMTWTIYSLLRHQDILAEVQRSIEREFQNLEMDSSLALNYDTVSGQHSLPFIQAALAESLRLNPAVPMEMKETTVAITLPDGTYLPKDAVVVWIPYSLARSPNIWGGDAAQFNIHRWLEQQKDGSYHVLTRTAYENPVFNAGPRMCIGKRMAEISMTRILTQLLWDWEFEEVRGPGERGGRRVLAESLTSPMAGGLPVKVMHSKWK